MRSFFRVAKYVPPIAEDYRTQRDFRGEPDPNLTEEEQWSWDAYSAFDTEEGARRQGRRIRRLGTHIVRYDIPDGSGIEVRQTFRVGHFDRRGDTDELHRYLADFHAEV